MKRAAWLGLMGVTVCLWSVRPSWAASETAVLKKLELLNQIPEEQLDEKTDPAFSILRGLYDLDSPDFLTLRTILGRVKNRSSLNPSVRCILAGVISQRWDTFAISGRLYLAGLQSKNADLRQKARKKLIAFVQLSDFPALIELLKLPGSKGPALEVLREVTGERLDASPKTWQTWWAKGGSKKDIVLYLLNDTRAQIKALPARSFDQERFWYLPSGVQDAQTPYADRPEKEQAQISAWKDWVASDVKPYVENWSEAKPILDRIVHRPDPRIDHYLASMVASSAYGDYASVVLAWRSNAGSLPAIQAAFKKKPTVGRALGRGSLGDKTALVDLLKIIDHHQQSPLSYKIMDDDAREMLSTLRTVGVIPAEQAFELLSHHNFEFEAAVTAKEKKKAFKAARAWLQSNAEQLSLDRRRGYYTLSPGQ